MPFIEQILGQYDPGGAKQIEKYPTYVIDFFEPYTFTTREMECGIVFVKNTGMANTEHTRGNLI